MAALFFGGIFLAAGTRDGSILASRLAGTIPGARWIFGTAALWLAGIEGVENAHGLSLAAMTASLILITLAVSAVLHLGIRALAQLVVAIFAHAFAKHFTPFVAAGKIIAVPCAAIFVDRTLFSRPPPAFP